MVLASVACGNRSESCILAVPTLPDSLTVGQSCMKSRDQSSGNNVYLGSFKILLKQLSRRTKRLPTETKKVRNHGLWKTWSSKKKKKTEIAFPINTGAVRRDSRIVSQDRANKAAYESLL